MEYEKYVKNVQGNNAGDIFLFALSTCVWCRKTKSLLNELGVEYSYVDVDLLEGSAKRDAVGGDGKMGAKRFIPSFDNRQLRGGAWLQRK